MRLIMTKTGITLSLMLGLSGVPFAAQADEVNDQIERFMQAMQATDQQEHDDINARQMSQINRALSNRVAEIIRIEGPQARAALKKAIAAWMAYQKAISDTVEISYEEGGGQGGGSAASHCDVMTAEGLLKVLNQFFSR